MGWATPCAVLLAATGAHTHLIPTASSWLPRHIPVRSVLPSGSCRRACAARGPFGIAMAADGGESGVETDPYTVLDVPRSASLADIRRAYRRLARSVHPDVGGSDEAFKKLTRALYAALAEAKSRQEWEAAEPRRKARARAASTWNDVRERAAARAGGSGGSADPGFQRARTRREAEEEETEASELRRRRWREIAFDGVWREHMPLRARPSQEARAAFLSAMEGAVQAYVDGGARKAESESLAARLDEQDRLLTELTNLEVLSVEVADVRQREACHRSRVRHLEEQLAKAERRAEMWRGAAPASRGDRIQAMERELAFLELGARLRGRLSEQRLALDRLQLLRRALEDRVDALPKREREFSE